MQVVKVLFPQGFPDPILDNFFFFLNKGCI